MNNIFKNTKFAILSITLIIYSLSFYYDISTIIINTMSFLILLEVVRTIHEYIFNDSHRIKLRYIIDSAILFGIRELFVGWVMIKQELIIALLIMLSSMITIGILIYFRKIVIVNSPECLECGIKINNCIK